MIQKNYYSLVLFGLISLSACHSTRQATTASPAPTPAASETMVSNPMAGSVANTEVSKGVYAPGMAELSAILPHFQDATLDQLNEGFQLYTAGACINCHKAKNISRYSVSEWKHIMDDMALKAEFNQAQKEAVYRYVLGIKATSANRN